MQSSKINEWLQIFASLGVLVGLLLVAYEIRDSNRLATSESVRGIEVCFKDVFISEYETNIAEIIDKSVAEPDRLSVADKLKMNGWLTAIMSCYQHWLNMHQLGVARYDGMDDLRGGVDFYLGSAFGRAWFAENKFWMYPVMAETIESELARSPVRTEPAGIAGWKPEIQ